MELICTNKQIFIYESNKVIKIDICQQKLLYFHYNLCETTNPQKFQHTRMKTKRYKVQDTQLMQ